MSQYLSHDKTDLLSTKGCTINGTITLSLSYLTLTGTPLKRFVCFFVFFLKDFTVLLVPVGSQDLCWFRQFQFHMPLAVCLLGHEINFRVLFLFESNT